MPVPQESVSMALFCDFENVALGVRDANYEKFDIKKVLERLLLKGSIVVKKAYCDWSRYQSFKATMHEASFELIDIPHVRQSGKNSADIRLVVDALDLCYTKSHVDTFVIISGDSDFSPLVSKLRENAKQVIGVGVKQSTSDLLITNCDEFIFYDDLVRESQRQARREARQQQPSQPQASRRQDEEGKRRDETEARRLKAINLAVETYDALAAERGDGGKIWASVLKEAIKRRRPDFNESYFGFKAFGNLLEAAQQRGLLQFGRDDKSGAYVYRNGGRGDVEDEAGEGIETMALETARPAAAPEREPKERRQSGRRRGGRQDSGEAGAQGEGRGDGRGEARSDSQDAAEAAQAREDARQGSFLGEAFMLPAFEEPEAAPEIAWREQMPPEQAPAEPAADTVPAASAEAGQDQPSAPRKARKQPARVARAKAKAAAQAPLEPDAQAAVAPAPVQPAADEPAQAPAPARAQAHTPASAGAPATAPAPAVSTPVPAMPSEPATPAVSSRARAQAPDVQQSVPASRRGATSAEPDASASAGGAGEPAAAQEGTEPAPRARKATTRRAPRKRAAKAAKTAAKPESA